MHRKITLTTADYLRYLAEKESRHLFSLFGIKVKHGDFSAVFRSFKGKLMGFAFANVFTAVHKPTIFTGLVMLFISILACYLLIHYERRHYRRAGLEMNVRRLIVILMTSTIISLFALIYMSFASLFSMIAIMLFFSTLSYSLE